ncbi:MAG: hypothetical protein R3F33_10420 [Planctomycetota bacterium]
MSRVLASAILLAGSASAQQVLHSESFDQDLGNWSSSGGGLWHWVDPASPCSLLVDGTGARGGKAYMGGTASCDFEGAFNNEQYLTLTQPLVVPGAADSARFRYQSYLASEMCNGWDFHLIEVSQDGGASWQYLSEDCTYGGVWHEVEVDLTAFVGSTIWLRLNFDPVDGVANGQLGWMVDDMLVESETCASYNYCTAAPNSVSPAGASIGFQGSGSVSGNDFALFLAGGPPGQFAHFFYGTGETLQPMAMGNLCVSTDANGYRRLYPAMQIDPLTLLFRSVDFTTLQNQYVISAGSTWKFQCWYRDYVGGQSVSNFSNALSVTFCD